MVIKKTSSVPFLCLISNPAVVIYWFFVAFYLSVGLLVRLALIWNIPADSSLSVWQCVKAVVVGTVGDLGMAVLLGLPLLIYAIGLNNWKYGKRVGWWIVSLLGIGLVYTYLPHNILQEYGGGAPLVGHIIMWWLTVSFLVRFLLPSIRDGWRRVALYLLWGFYVLCTLCIAGSEVVFWEEFGVRFNFIAVDYLVYTNEVIGNIVESYPIVPMVGGVLLLTILIVWLQSRRIKLYIHPHTAIGKMIGEVVLYSVLAAMGYGLVSITHHLDGGNQYVTQLQQNGVCDFFIAFRSNRLQYDQFYPMLSKNKCDAEARRMAGLDASGNKKLFDDSCDSIPAHRYNIVLVTVESLSADFLEHFGNTEHLTPNLDTLMRHGLCFENLYAVGNRTVRGLEALSLCIPPSAGESVIKRHENTMGDLSLGNILRHEGYHVQFIYGGDSYFDNMGDFFSHNGYEVVDRKAFKARDVTFANIWGVCDGDLFDKALQVMDVDTKLNKPFFCYLLTTSNHRPYTYPEGVIKTVGKPESRANAVRYTDATIGKFLSDASLHAWFRNTVFIVVADHCASSAGRTSLPVDKYHIPCVVFCPELIRPHSVSTLCSQIDVMPTVLSLLRLPVCAHFAGNNVLSPQFRPRAFMATYQDLGYYQDNVLTVLSPVRQVRQFRIHKLSDGTHEEIPVSSSFHRYVLPAVAAYQFWNTRN